MTDDFEELTEDEVEVEDDVECENEECEDESDTETIDWWGGPSTFW